MSRIIYLFTPFLIAIAFLSPQLVKPESSMQANTNLGWSGEIMPLGMRRAEQQNEYIWDKDGSVMVYVPAGQFIMGRDWIIPNEKPVHSVRLDAFYIDKYEVTRAA